MAVKGGCVRDLSQQQQQQQQPHSEATGASTAAEDSLTGDQSAASKKRRKVNKKRRVVSKRTKLYISTDPCGSLKDEGELSAHTKDGGGGGGGDMSSYKLVTVIGPLQNESDALIVDKIWNFRSRGPVPRAFWGLFIAERFGLDIWMSMPDLFPVEALAIRQEESGKVFLDANNVVNAVH